MPAWNVYIDESGDEGFKISPHFIAGQGSSRWFIVAAVVIAAEDDQRVASAVNRIKSRLWPGIVQHRKPLHWRELKHDQKSLVVGELLNEQFLWLAAAFEKCHPKTDASRFDSRLVRQRRPDLKTPLYNYVVRLLSERLTKYARETGRTLDVIFENRSTLSMAEMGSYLNLLETYPGPYGTPTIPPGLIQGVRAEAKANSKMLQIVDVCAGALNNALEPNRYGEVDDSYLKVLAPKLRRYNGQLWGYGLKLFPGNYQDCMTRISQYRWMADL